VALKQHKDEGVRYDQQVENSRDYVLPFIAQTKPIAPGTRVLEIGCGEGGVLVPFAEKGCYCVGVDLDKLRIDIANDFLSQYVAEGKMKFMYKNVYDEDFLQEYRNYFDVVILKDTIEHIPEQEKFIPYLKNLVKPDGQVFFGFPPWYMPFGGHQQVCEHKLPSILPYYHILPRAVYKALLKLMGENERTVITLLEVYDTRISIERFEKIIRKSGFKVKNKTHFLFNPIYKYKFGVEARKQWGPITKIPFLRNFVTTCVYYTVGL
jgi:2-polyprenyl-3-methyl-5-hydroxy-6-metoxy-1,4-benzoquinol methylase